MRAEKLKDTRLLIQTCADESFDAIKSCYEFLKEKLEEDYQSLKQELKTSVDAQLEKVNDAIATEEAKQSHASAVTSYVKNTLATTSGALNIEVSVEELIPAMKTFKDIEPLVTSRIHRHNSVAPNSDDDVNLIGKIESIPAQFHRRFQPLLSSKTLQSAAVGKTIDIELKQKACVYRVNIGFGKITLCFFDINLIVICNTDGSKTQRIDLTDKLNVPLFAMFLNTAELLVGSKNGLAIFNVETESVVKVLSNDAHCYVFIMDEKLYVLASTGSIQVLEQHNGDLIETIELELSGNKVDPFASVIVTSSDITFCNNDDTVLEFSLP